MVITQINLNGLELISKDYVFTLSGLQDIEKDIVTSDMLTNGNQFGRSKIKAKTPTLNGFVTSDEDEAMWALNRAIAPNGLKEMIINNKYKCYVEIVNRAGDSANSKVISCQLTLPDPYLYEMDPRSIQLGAEYSGGVEYGTGKGVTWGASKNKIMLNESTMNFSGFKAWQWLQNGDFSASIPGWDNYFSHIYDIEFRQNTATTYGGLEGPITQVYSPGQKIFMRTRVKTLSTYCKSLVLQLKSSQSVQTVSVQSSPNVNTYYTLYGIATVPPGSTGNLYFDVFSASDNGTILVEQMVVDGSGLGNIAIDMDYMDSNPFDGKSADQIDKILESQNYWYRDKMIGGINANIKNDVIELDGKAESEFSICLAPNLGAASSFPQIGNVTYAMKTGQKYTCSTFKDSGTITGTTPNIIILDEMGNAAANHIIEVPISGSSSTFTAGTRYNEVWSASSNIRCYFLWITAGTVFNGYRFKLQLEKSDTATEWYPYGYSNQGINFGALSGETEVITNIGNYDAYPVITIVGTCSGISVSNKTTGEVINLNPSLSDSDTLVIDCHPETRGVYLNGVANIGLKSGVGWIKCVPGDNLLCFSGSSLQNKKHCTLQLQSRWI